MRRLSIGWRPAARVLPVLAIVSIVLATGLTAAILPPSFARRVPDIDGDRIPDPMIWRVPSSGLVTAPTFYVPTSKSGFTNVLSFVFGKIGDYVVPADYDNDGITDIAVYTPNYVNTWSILLSSTGFTSQQTIQWGLDDIPVVGDYDGDGKTDIAVFRPADGGWYVLQNGSGFKSAFVVRWGSVTSTPAPGDYDGDGRLDIAVYEPADFTWYILQGGSNFRTAFAQRFGAAGIIPVPGDYDGDGSTDLGIYDSTSSTFQWMLRAGNYTRSFSKQWGVAGDVPVPGDYDGDGKLDLAVFRPSTGAYYILKGPAFTSGFTRVSGVGGTGTDTPVMAGR